MPSTSRDRQTERLKESDFGRHDIKKEPDKLNEKNETEGLKLTVEQSSDKSKQIEGSERTRGRLTKTEDRDKIKSSTKVTRTVNSDSEVKKGTDVCMPENLSKKPEKKVVDSSEIVVLDSSKAIGRSEVYENGHDKNKQNSNGLDVTNIHESEHSPLKHCPAGMTPQISRFKRVTSPEDCVKRTSSPEKRKRLVSPVGKRKDTDIDEQEMPENLCIKDREKSKDTRNTSETELVKTQSIVTTSTVNVNSVLNIITTDVNSKGQIKGKWL